MPIQTSLHALVAQWSTMGFLLALLQHFRNHSFHETTDSAYVYTKFPQRMFFVQIAVAGLRSYHGQPCFRPFVFSTFQGFALENNLFKPTAPWIQEVFDRCLLQRSKCVHFKTIWWCFGKHYEVLTRLNNPAIKIIFKYCGNNTFRQHVYTPTQWMTNRLNLAACGFLEKCGNQFSFSWISVTVLQLMCHPNMHANRQEINSNFHDNLYEKAKHQRQRPDHQMETGGSETRMDGPQHIFDTLIRVTWQCVQTVLILTNGS